MNDLLGQQEKISNLILFLKTRPNGRPVCLHVIILANSSSFPNSPETHSDYSLVSHLPRLLLHHSSLGPQGFTLHTLPTAALPAPSPLPRSPNHQEWAHQAHMPCSLVPPPCTSRGPLLTEVGLTSAALVCVPMWTAHHHSTHHGFLVPSPNPNSP